MCIYILYYIYILCWLICYIFWFFPSHSFQHTQSARNCPLVESTNKPFGLFWTQRPQHCCQLYESSFAAPLDFFERHLSSKSSGAHEIVNACEECAASHRISPDGFKRSGCYFVQSSCWCTGQGRVEGIIWSHHADQAVEADLGVCGCSTWRELLLENACIFKIRTLYSSYMQLLSWTC